MEQDLAIYRKVVENLRDGVMVIDFAGSITIVNEAACRILDLDRDAVIGRSFADTCILHEGFDEFTEIVLEATMQRTSVERRVSEVRIREEVRSITMTTSYLSSMRNGRTAPIAVIAVFTDLTEIRELREAELRLARENESQHKELQKAYRDIESTNIALSQILKKVKVARGLSIVVVASLFLTVAAYYLQPLDPFSLRPLDALVSTVASAVSDKKPDDVVGPTSASNLHTVVVTQSPLHSTISLRGHLAPGHIVSVISPIDSHIKNLFIKNGQHVTKGDLLMELDTEKIQIEYRQVEVDYIRKREHLRTLEDWENSTEMADAQRRFRHAKLSLDNSKKQLERNNFLLEQGIIPSSQQEEAQRSYEGQLLDFEAATQELVSVKNKANADERRVAALEVENVYSRLKKLEEKLTMSAVEAPISGIIQEMSGGPEQKTLNAGRSLTQGEQLLNIANFEQIAVSTTVDEVDVGKIRAGQLAWITGPGFPDLRLDGKVTQVASRATGQRWGGGGLPQFEINVSLDKLSTAHRDILRVGMSAHVTIVIYNQPEALLVPIDAVVKQHNGTWVQILDKETGSIEQRAVELGLTTLDSVEVVKGIRHGEEVVLSGI